jgi:hypothetical protein
MTTPTIPQILAHVPQGGLWLVMPAATPAGQPRPLFAQLGVRIARGGDIATIEGGDMAATIQENEHLQGADWVPVNSRGKRI